MTKHKSEGLRNRLKIVEIMNKKRFKELLDRENKTPLEWEEFHILKRLKEIKKSKREHLMERGKNNE